jgi:hypothetical protein
MYGSYVEAGSNWNYMCSMTSFRIYLFWSCLLCFLFQFFFSTPLRHTEEAEIRLHLFLSSAVDGYEWLTSRPSRFNPGNENLYPLNRRLGRPQRWYRRVGNGRNSLPLLVFKPWAFQHVVESSHWLRYSGSTYGGIMINFKFCINYSFFY